MARPEALQALNAPPHWRAVDLLSDLHLSEATPRTEQAFIDHLRCTEADAVLVLGDLFEVWVGDEQRLHTVEGRCLQALANASQRCFIGFMAGNRDFLLSPGVLAEVGTHLLADPMPLRGFGADILLSHGDAMCVADTEYQAFRREVRSPAWQEQFLSRPLDERIHLARHIRNQSQQRKTQRQSLEDWADVDDEVASQALDRARCSALVHGHTHRPGDHDLGAGLRRWVLSDWDLDSTSSRAQVLRLTRAGAQRIAPCQPIDRSQA